MGLLELVALILIVAWIAGFSFNIAGPFIHLLLVLAVITFLLRFIDMRGLKKRGPLEF